MSPNFSILGNSGLLVEDASGSPSNTTGQEESLDFAETTKTHSSDVENLVMVIFEMSGLSLQVTDTVMQPWTTSTITKYSKHFLLGKTN